MASFRDDQENDSDTQPTVNLNFGQHTASKVTHSAPANRLNLKEELRLGSNKEFVDWLNSKLVKPFWMEFWKDFLSHQPANRATFSLAQIQSRISRWEANGKLKYSDPNPEKEDWDGQDHQARFLVQMKNINVQSNKGVFFSRYVPGTHIDRILWAVKTFLMKHHSPSSGIYLLGDIYSRENVSLSTTPGFGSLSDPNTPFNSKGWEEEALSPRASLLLERESAEYNPKERYWQFVHIVEALQRAELLDTEAEPAPGNRDPEARANTAWIPPTTFPQPTVEERIFNERSYEDTANIEASILKEINTADHDSDIIIPTKESLERFQKIQTAFDNKAYQREDHQEACKFLNIPSAEFPRMISMNRSATLKHWQPVAIKAIMKIRENKHVTGAILGDSVGLGKTWETIGVMLKIWEDYDASVFKAKNEGTEIPKAKPFLVVVPPGLIMQWVSEIRKMTDALEVFVYYGSDLDGTQNLDRGLTRHDEIFNGDPKNGRIVVLTSYKTFNMRHGPGAVKSWCAKNLRPYRDGITTTPADFPFGLRGCFHGIILDEAHAVRNQESAQSRALHWVGGKFYLLITATPIYNRKEDFRGYMPLLFRRPSLWKGARWETVGIVPDERIFYLSENHPAKHLCCTEEAVETYIMNHKVPRAVAGVRLREVLAQVLLRRTIQSRVPFDSPKTIGSDIPPLQRKTIKVNYNSMEKEMYDTYSPPYQDGLFMRSPSDPRRVIWNMKKLRKLVLLTSWLGFYYLQSELHAEAIASVCEQLPEGIVGTAFATAISGGGPKTKSLSHFFENAAEMTGHRRTWTLEFLLRGSPKMRAMLKILRDQVIVYGEKAIIWSQFPAEQVYIAATLREANIDADVLHSGLSVSDRGVLIQRFTTLRDECMVLVCNYSIGSAGLNLQGLCRNVHIFNPGLSSSIADQAIGRVWRLGQERVVLVYEYRLAGTFNMELVERNKLKSIPGLVAEMSKNVYQSETEESDGDVDIGRWVLRDGELHQLIDGERPARGDNKDQDAILNAFVDLLG